MVMENGTDTMIQPKDFPYTDQPDRLSSMYGIIEHAAAASDDESGFISE
jgi:hypothetical protein